MMDNAALPEPKGLLPLMIVVVVPGAVGVPLIKPVLVFRLRPPGKPLAA